MRFLKIQSLTSAFEQQTYDGTTHGSRLRTELRGQFCLITMVVLAYYYTSIKPLLKCGIYALIYAPRYLLITNFKQTVLLTAG